jgi:hypothetical protein
MFTTSDAVHLNHCSSYALLLWRQQHCSYQRSTASRLGPPASTSKHDLAMANNHDMPYANTGNLASRATLAEALSLLRDYRFSMHFDVQSSEDRNPVKLGYHNLTTGHRYRATATWSEIHEDRHRSDLQKVADLFHWATLTRRN